MNLKNKNILVIGLAISGVPLVKVLSKLGANVIVNDLKPSHMLKSSLEELKDYNFKTILGRHPDDIRELGDIDLVVVSPGVPLNIDFIKKLRDANIEIISEIEMAYRINKAEIIAITGTNGKTTTTALTSEIFKNAIKKVYAVGNIGVSATEKAVKSKEDEIMVMEVSSFQLEGIVNFRPKVATILNITPDHLNRHGTMENYIDIKFDLFKNQNEDDFAIINYDDEICRKKSTDIKSKVIFFSNNTILDEGVFVEDNNIVVKYEGQKHIIISTNDIRIPGEHNIENALAATAMAFIMGIDAKIINRTLKEFNGVEHRIEHVTSINNINFVNDSKATNTDAAIKAIKAINGPIILLAGGLDKGSEFDDFIKSFDKKVKKVFLYGETAEKIFMTAKKLNFNEAKIVKSLDKAVNFAYDEAEPGDTILLSPACASWDMYSSFEERGNHFKQLVRDLGRS